MSNVYRFKTKPWKHQVAGLKRALKQGYLGVLWEPGTGKTKLIVDWACALHQQGKLQRLLIVCPLSVIGVWEDEFEAHAPLPYFFYPFTRHTKKIPYSKTRLVVMVANYDVVWRRPEHIKAFDPQFIVADESQRIKKPSARRSRFLRRWSHVPYRAILTGTPTPKGFMDLYSQWTFLNPKRFGTNFNAFKNEYIRFGGFKGYQIMGYRNVPDLLAKVDEDAMVVRSDDCLDIPKATFQRVPVVLEPEARKAYDKMAYELFLELKNGEVSDAANVAVKIMRLQQITGGWIKSDEGNLHQISTAKLFAAQERLEDLWDGDERVVVFARFRPEVQALYDFGLRSGIPTHVIRGGQGRDERDDARRTFQREAGPSLIVLQIQSGGLGITLHASSQVLFYSVTHALDDYVQAWRRVHRGGQTRPQRFQHLVGVGTIDVDIYANLRAKKNIMDVVMKDPKILAKALAANLGIDES